MKEKTSKLKRTVIGVLALILAVIQPFGLLPDSSPLSTMVSTEAAASVKLNKTQLSLFIKKGYTLKMKGTKSKPTWSTSNSSIAAVSSKGRVTGKKKGTATITAKIGKKKYRCKVTVKQPVTQIKFEKDTITLTKKGQTAQLKATAYPKSANNRNITWRSTQEDVVTVTPSGKIEAVSDGHSILIATAKDGSKTFATCVVLVELPNQSFTVKNRIIGSSDPKLTATYYIPQRTICSSCGELFFGTDDWYQHSFEQWHGGSLTVGPKEFTLKNNETCLMANAFGGTSPYNSNVKISIHSPFLNQKHEISYQIDDGPIIKIPKDKPTEDCGYDKDGVPYVIYPLENRTQITIYNKLLK